MLHLSPATTILNENPAMSHEQLQPLFKVMVLMRPCKGKIPTSNMGLKQWHKTDEKATTEMKMGWKSESNKNNLKCYSLIQQHRLLLNMQNDLGLVPRKMVKFNPRLSRILSTVFLLSACNSSLQNTDEPLLCDTVMI